MEKSRMKNTAKEIASKKMNLVDRTNLNISFPGLKIYGGLNHWILIVYYPTTINRVSL